MGSITEATILHHVCITLFLLWILNFFNYGHSFTYILCFVYLFLVHEAYALKLRKKVQFQEKRESNQRRVLSESETVRWLNYAIEKIWPICMEEIVSQRMLLPVVPWFLQKYKPWTVRDVAIQHLYLGRSPPTFTDMRVVQQASGDDHLVLELGMNFLTADDMCGVLGVKLRKSLGFGMLAKLHLLGLHVEGKVLVGIKFLREWPFISRLRICFVEPPYFHMTVKPIFTRGLDVTELPGIAGWIDNLLALVFEQTLVEPNMLVVDVEKFVSPQQENWFSVDAKEQIAVAIVEVIEAAEIKASDLNGLADPYVKGRVGPYRFRTKTNKKTLTPKWLEKFKIPICSWESQNMLALEVRDKDHLFNETLGECCININELRDGQRHEMWLPLQNIKMGKLRLAITVSQGNRKDSEPSNDTGGPEEDKKAIVASHTDSFSSSNADKFEGIYVEGQTETGVWIHQPGSEMPQSWEPRKGKGRRLDAPNLNGSLKTDDNEGSGTDEIMESYKRHAVLRGFKKLGSAFRKSPRDEKPRSSFTEGTGDDEEVLKEENEGESPRQLRKRDVAMGILKQAEKSARSLKVVVSRKSSPKSKSKSEKSELSNEDSSDDESFPPGFVIPGSALSSSPPL